MRKLTEEQETHLLEYGTLPIPLPKAELDEPFLYVRGLGVIYPNHGHHFIIFATLYAFQKGLESAGDGLFELDMEISEMEEAMLKQEGIAWMSGVGDPVVRCTKLNYAEKTFLRGAQEIE